MVSIVDFNPIQNQQMNFKNSYYDLELFSFVILLGFITEFMIYLFQTINGMMYIFNYKGLTLA